MLSPLMIERAALVGLGAALALYGPASVRTLRRAIHFKPASEPLEVIEMPLDDKSGKAFVLQGYCDIQVAEGKVASEEEKAFVRSGLDSLAQTGGVLLCRSGSKLVGYLWYLDADVCAFGPGCYACEKEDYVWVHTVYTVPEFRRKGVASALHKRLDSVVLNRGREVIWLDVYDNNPPSIFLHRGLGFKPVTMVYRKALK